MLQKRGCFQGYCIVSEYGLTPFLGHLPKLFEGFCKPRRGSGGISAQKALAVEVHPARQILPLFINLF